MKIPDDKIELWPVWRLVLYGFAPLSEIKTYYLSEIFEANEMLDLKIRLGLA